MCLIVRKAEGVRRGHACALTLRRDAEDGLGRAPVDIGRVADDTGVRAVIGERGVQQLDGRVGAGRAAQPLHTVLEVIVQRRVRLRREVEELERNTERVQKQLHIFLTNDA